MHNLGHTRSVNRRDHLLHTPDTFVRTTMPTIQGGHAVVHISERGGAAFTQYTAELEQEGTLVSNGSQRFIFCLEGSATIVFPVATDETSTAGELNSTTMPNLRIGSYVYLPADSAATLFSLEASRFVVIEKAYEPHPMFQVPPAVFGHEDNVVAMPLMGDPDLEVRSLLPDSPSFDFAVNTMTYQPGAALSMVEIHVMEHGLLMLSGGGIYRLGEAWYPVTAGDFIWMAPYCPQWFGAIGKEPAKYLIYKDFNRHPGNLGRTGEP